MYCRIVSACIGLLLGALVWAGPAAADAAYPVSYLISAGVTAQGANPNSPPPGANDYSCRPSAAHPQPVVLVHGLLANQTVNWQTISPILANNGYCVFSLTYGTLPNVSSPIYQPGGLARMEDSAQQLSDFVDGVLQATHASKVDIVGHSEGSLMPNWYVKYLGGAAKVKRYVGITPLWHGTDLAGLATLSQIAEAWGVPPELYSVIDAECQSCRQFLKGSDFIEAMRQGGIAAPGVTYTNLITRNDELVVPYTSGIELGSRITNIIVQNQCILDQAEHVSMAADPIVAQDVLNALDPAHPKPVPCTPVLPLVGAPLYTGTQ
jgi:triacylglycerol esterase/lipase EstA (alpha/beta hydrolase family)